jgi:hypothetical protein
LKTVISRRLGQFSCADIVRIIRKLDSLVKSWKCISDQLRVNITRVITDDFALFFLFTGIKSDDYEIV